MNVNDYERVAVQSIANMVAAWLYELGGSNHELGVRVECWEAPDDPYDDNKAFIVEVHPENPEETLPKSEFTFSRFEHAFEEHTDLIPVEEVVEQKSSEGENYYIMAVFLKKSFALSADKQSLLQKVINECVEKWGPAVADEYIFEQFSSKVA